VDVVYYDRRRDPRDIRNDVSLQSSFDGGQSFSSRLRLSQRSFDSRIGFGDEAGLPDLGSRLGLVSADAGALAVWTDTRAGTRASKKQDLAAGLVSFSRPARLAEPAEGALRYEQAEDGAWGSHSPDVEGVFALGQTREEVETRMAGALAAHLEHLRESDRPIPDPHTHAGRVAA